MMLKALGDPTRLSIFQFLRCCPQVVTLDETGEVRPTEGPTVGEVCCSLFGPDRAVSTISFHLKELRVAGLINMDRRGKHMLCSIRPEALAALQEFFAAGCCSDSKREK